MTSTETERQPSLAAWQGLALHTITCSTGQRLRIRIRGIVTILEHGDMPADLRDLAIAEAAREDGAAGKVAAAVRDEPDHEKAVAELIRFASFQRELVRDAVEEIETSAGVWAPVRLTDEDMRALPEDDLGMIADIVLRQRNTDARGVRLGVEPIERWAAFRDAHECGEACPGCQALIDELSSADLGAL